MRRLAVVHEPKGPRGIPLSEYLWMIGEKKDAPVVDLHPPKSHEDDLALRNALLSVGQEEEEEEPSIIEWITNAIYDLGRAISNIAWHVLIEVGGIPVNVDWLVSEVNRLPKLAGAALTRAICEVYGEMVKFYRYVRNLLVGEADLPRGLREIELVRRQFEQCRDIIETIPAVALRLLSRAVALVLSPAKTLSRLIGTAAASAAELLATTAERTWKRASENEAVLATAERLVQVGIVATSALNIISENALGPAIDQIDKFVEWASGIMGPVLKRVADAIEFMVARTGLADLVTGIAESVRNSVVWDTVYKTAAWFTSTSFWDVATRIVRWLMTAVGTVTSKLTEFVTYISTAFTRWVQRLVDFLVPWDSVFYQPVPINTLFWIEQNLITGPAGEGAWDADKREQLRDSGERLRRLIEESARAREKRLREIRGLGNMIDSAEMVLKYSLPLARGLVRDAELLIPSEDVTRLEDITAFRIRETDPSEEEGLRYWRLLIDTITDQTEGPDPTPGAFMVIGQDGNDGKPGVRRRRRRPPARPLPSVTPPGDEGPSVAMVPTSPPQRRLASSRLEKSIRAFSRGAELAVRSLTDEATTSLRRAVKYSEERDSRMRTDPEFREHQRRKSKWGVAFGLLALGAHGLSILWNLWSAEQSRRDDVSIEISKWLTDKTATEEARNVEAFVGAWKATDAPPFSGSFEFGITSPPVSSGDVANWMIGPLVDFFQGLQSKTTEELAESPVVQAYLAATHVEWTWRRGRRGEVEVLTEDTRTKVLSNVRSATLKGAASLRDHLSNPPEGWTWSQVFSNGLVRVTLGYLSGGTSEVASWWIKVVDALTFVMGQALPLYWIFHAGYLLGAFLYAAFREKSADARNEMLTNFAKFLVKDFAGFALTASLGISAVSQLAAGETEKALVRGVGSITAMAGGIGLPTMARKFAIGM